MVGISWFEALAYVAWLNESSNAASKPAKNMEFALPNEDEWEYAARGRDSSLYPWKIAANFAVLTPAMANYSDAKLERTTAVGLFAANEHFRSDDKALAIYDQIGNVWEWTQGRWGSNFEKTEFSYGDDCQAQFAARNQLHADDLRIIRGGAWVNKTQGVRAAYRNRDHPFDCDGSLGLRLVCRPMSGIELSTSTSERVIHPKKVANN